MPGFREKFIQKSNKATRLAPGSAWQKLSGQKLIMPFYHTISDEPIPHIHNLYPIKSTKDFVKDLDFLLKHYKPISYADLQKLNRKGEQPSKPSFLLSFDDGLSEFSDVIAPILMQKGIPAICFLNSAFIDNADLFYRYKASLLIEEITANPKLKSQLNGIFQGDNNLSQDIKAVSYRDRAILDVIASRIDCDFGDFLNRQSPYLTSSQIEKLIAQGFHFGAHSIDHPEYQHIDYSEQLRQTKESMDSIASRFNLDYRAFSFPFTDFNISKRFFDEIYKNGTVEMSFGCSGQRKESFPKHYQRIAFEMEVLSGEQILNAELLYFILKQPFGKNRILRK